MLDVFNQLKSALAGRKTYLIVFVFVLCLIAEKFLGLDIPYFSVGEDWLKELIAMLGLGTIRAGIATSK
jgi:hypothetical protein